MDCSVSDKSFELVEPVLLSFFRNAYCSLFIVAPPHALYHKYERGEKVYEKIQKLLDDNEMSAYRLSKEADIPYTCLADWKSGKSKPKADKLMKLADYFGVPIEYFLKE